VYGVMLAPERWSECCCKVPLVVGLLLLGLFGLGFTTPVCGLGGEWFNVIDRGASEGSHL